MVTAPKKWKSSPTHPEAHLAYITDAEQDLLIKFLLASNAFIAFPVIPPNHVVGLVRLKLLQ